MKVLQNEKLLKFLSVNSISSLNIPAVYMQVPYEVVPYEKACIAGERRFGLKLPFPIRIIGQGRSSFHLSVLESVYIKTQNPVLCKQKDFIFSLGIFKRYKFLSNNGNWANWPLLGPLRLI